MNYPFTIPQAEPPTVTHFVGTTPAAGNAYVYTCPAGVIERIIYCNFIFTADATVASRICTCKTERGGIPYQVHISPIAITASQVRGVYFNTIHQRNTCYALGTHLQEALSKDMILFPTDEFRVEIDNIQAADTIDVLRLTKQVWITA
jgi:hypothetical protein